MIDRFDVRAHLDTLPAVSTGSPKLTPEEDWEERQANYERYRILIQNDFLASECFTRYFDLYLEFGTAFLSWFFISIHLWGVAHKS